uniref:Uncharacterized protein n=1 Tax=Glossina pallidipes TaxID=7398 RepID=A0A1B0AFW6_GLOPL
MNFFSHLTAFIATVIVVETLLVHALYRFVTEDHDIFRACSDRAGVGGPSDFIDFSGADIHYDDEGIHMNGSFAILSDIKRTDRVSPSRLEEAWRSESLITRENAAGTSTPKAGVDEHSPGDSKRYLGFVKEKGNTRTSEKQGYHSRVAQVTALSAAGVLLRHKFLEAFGLSVATEVGTITSIHNCEALEAMGPEDGNVDSYLNSAHQLTDT